MTKTKKIIIFIVAVILIGVVGWWFYSTHTTSPSTPGTGGFSIGNFIPFGNPPENIDQNNTTPANPDSVENPVTRNVPIQKLRKLWERPVAGAVIWNKATTSTIRFVEKATGNVYEARNDQAEIKRLTNNTIPKIMRAFWLPDGSGFLAQTIDQHDTIETSFIKLKPATSDLPYEAVISKLPTGIAELTVSPDGKKIFYLAAGGTAKGFVANPDGTSPVQVYSNFLTEWIPTWFGTNSILLAGKASAGSNSSGFFLNPNSKTLTNAFSNVSGGTGLARGDGKYLLLGNNTTLWLKEVVGGTMTELNLNTLSEKCTWDKGDQKFIFCGVPKNLPNGNYPDSWYRGEVSTNDLIQKINVLDIYKYVLVDLELESREQIDTDNLSSDPLGNFLIFQNKLDQSLWLLDTR